MAKYNQFNSILSAIKRCFSRSPIRREALEEAKAEDIKGPKGGARYYCAGCSGVFGMTDIQVDHIDPIIPFGIVARELSWDTIINRTFCDVSNLQALCSKCHKKKSAEETAERKRLRDSAKEKTKDK